MVQRHQGLRVHRARGRLEGRVRSHLRHRTGRSQNAPLHEGQRVSYELRPGRDGKFSAEDLSVAD